MVKKALIVLLMALFPVTVWANQEPTLVVLPFALHSQEDLSHLKKGIPDLLERQLQHEGVVTSDASAKAALGALEEPITIETARSALPALNAQYAVFGSISKIGNMVSVDVTLVGSAPGRKPFSFFESGTGLENLPKIIEKVARNIALIVLEKVRIVEITVTGNKRIESSAVLAAIKIKPGDVYSPEDIDKELKAVYALGYFEDVSVDVEDIPGGKKIWFQVVEKPSIKEVTITGNKEVKTDKALEAMNIKPYSILNADKISAGIEAIKDLYRKEGYLNAKIDYKLEPQPDQSVVVALTVEEGNKVLVKKVEFQGNKSFSTKQLRKQMETKKKGWLSWITGSGKLDMAKLRNDVDRITSFYFNNGYIQAKVGEPDVRFEEDAIYVTIPVDEGPKFNFGEVTLEGDFIKPQEELAKVLQAKKDEVYNRELVRKDIASLRDIYADQGYAYAEIDPLVSIDPEHRLANITYQLRKANKMYIERISVTGNRKTRDKVIRRELQLEEGSQFSSGALRKSNEKLHRLDYFETVEITPIPGSDDTKLNLRVDVAEKKTGSFSIGAGFSSQDGLIGIFDITQANFRGLGQTISGRGQVGGRNQRFSVLFNEPWTFDIPLSTTYEVYNWLRQYEDFDKDSTGGSISASYPIWHILKANVKYLYEDAEVTDIDEDASTIIKDQEGPSTTSSVTLGLRWDSRDKTFITTRGQDHFISVEHAGTPFGGSNAFTKYILGTGWYFPLFWGTVGYASGKIGYVSEDEEGGLPLYEKFYLGGINSLRGFQTYEVSPKDAATGDRIGGDKMLLFNLEYRFPVLQKGGLWGEIFLDAGNVYADSDTYDLSNVRKSVGLGMRWYSPMGPLRIVYGVNLNPEEDEDKTVFDFTMGGAFE
jgi:outer membrane protein insertion porin family